MLFLCTWIYWLLREYIVLGSFEEINKDLATVFHFSDSVKFCSFPLTFVINQNVKFIAEKIIINGNEQIQGQFLLPFSS